MFERFHKRDVNRDKSPADEVGLGQIELEIQEAYIADKNGKVARLDKAALKVLRISAGDSIILFADDRPVIVKALPQYPSDKSSGVIRINETIREQLNRDIGDTLAVRGIGNTKIDKVVNYLLLDKYSNKSD